MTEDLHNDDSRPQIKGLRDFFIHVWMDLQTLLLCQTTILFRNGEGNLKISDTQEFMQLLYRYWREGGYWGVVCQEAIDVVFLGCLWLTAVVLCMYFRWGRAVDGVSPRPPLFNEDAHWPFVIHQSVVGYVVGMSFVGSTLGGFVLQCVAFVRTVLLHLEVEQLVQEAGIYTSRHLTPLHGFAFHLATGSKQSTFAHHTRPHVVPPKLRMMGWGEFLDRVCSSLKEKDRMVDSSRLSPLLAIQTMMRVDNYMISVHEQLRMLQQLHPQQQRCRAAHYLGTDTMKYLLKSMVDPFQELYPPDRCLIEVRNAARRRAFILLSCFALYAVYALIRTLVANVARIKGNAGHLWQLTWNHHAEWTLRLYNEVEHLYLDRLERGRTAACNLLECAGADRAVHTLASRLSSIVICILVVTTFIDANMLLEDSVWGISLVGWLTAALFVHNVCTEGATRDDGDTFLLRLTSLTEELHYADAAWYHSPNAFARSLKSDYLQRYLYTIGVDLLSTVLMPLILMWSTVDGSLELLVHCVHARATSADGADFVDFSPRMHCQRNQQGGEQSGPPMQFASAAPIWESEEMEVVTRNKLTMSMGSFCAVYTTWMNMRTEVSPGTTSRGSPTTSPTTSIDGSAYVGFQASDCPALARIADHISRRMREISASAMDGHLHMTPTPRLRPRLESSLLSAHLSVYARQKFMISLVSSPEASLKEACSTDDTSTTCYGSC